MIANNYKSSRPSIVQNLIVLCSSILFTSMAFANPQGGVVTSGNATIAQAPNSTVIQQNSQQAIIEWQSFNISAKDKTHFQQPTNGVALNRINANQGMTQIYGQLSATGKIILVNAAGIYFGVGSVIHVGGLIASTSNISNANFLAGKYIFDQPSPYHAGIVNDGIIKAADYGLVALIGSSVTNHGMIQAELGSIILATGDKFTLDFYGDQLINFSVDARASANGRIENTGSLIADGGKILVTAEAAQGVLDNVIDMQGVAQAHSVLQQDGQIILSAATGDINIGGELTTSGKKGMEGGIIQVTAANIKIEPLAIIHANGDAGGGSITLTANKVLVNGNLSAIGKSSDAVGGNITIAANTINLYHNAMLNVSGGAAGGVVSLSGKNNSADHPVPASYIGISHLTNVLANSWKSGPAGTINLKADSISIAGNLSAQGTGATSVGGKVIVAANSFVTEAATLNVSGNAGGGKVIVATYDRGPTKPAYINIDAKSVVLANAINTGTAGSVKFLADAVSIAGNISAQGMSPTSLGGNIQVAANTFVAAGATMNVTGGTGGGTVSIAKQNPVATTSYINIDAGSSILANAFNAGTAGTINLTASDVTLSGNISAQGLSAATLGGNIQVAANSFIAEGAIMNVSSGAGGGNIIINKAAYINIDAGSVVLANALNTGTAGNIILAADKITIAGNVSAEGVGATTLGGNIEVAANSFLAAGATMNVSAKTVAGTVTVAGIPDANGKAKNSTYIGIDGLSMILANAMGDNGIGGQINLYGDTVNVAGKLSAQASGANTIGGNIGVYAQNVSVAPGAVISANADFVAGELFIGSNPNSPTGSTTSQYVNISAASYITAAAMGDSGFGGEITVSSDQTYIGGTLDVSGLSFAASGGEVVVTGDKITVAPLAVINASGQQFGGEILLGGNPASPQTTAAVDVDAGSRLTAAAYGNSNQENNIPTGGSIQVYATNTTIDGSLDVAAALAGSGDVGGKVSIFANNTVVIGATAQINAQGDANGGVVLIGGDQQGHGLDPHAQFTNVAQGSNINTSSFTSGNGGDVVVWSDKMTNFGGSIDARGGSARGNGAQVEVSGKQMLNYHGTIDLEAPHGNTGTITLDPQNITIQNAGPNTPNSDNSVLTVATLENMLLTANVLVLTSTSGNEPGDITVANNVSWNNTNKLTLSAYRDVNINANISNTAGGSLAVLADNTVDGVGTITFSSNGNVNFGGGGQVFMSYEPSNNNFRYPNVYSNNVHVSNGSTVSYNPLNYVTPENNNAVISSFSVVPNIMESLSLALGQEPIEVVMPDTAPTTLALENNLEVITETSQKPVSVILMDQPAGSGCGDSATCVSNEFVIE
ncbi:MAG: filamentous hemagglutinin N-terminal domain-containing protein [Pseudomonadota bacterium]